MNKSEFLKKWGVWDFPGIQISDRRKELKKDLNEILADKSTEAYSPSGNLTFVYIPGAEEETEANIEGWFSVISHT